MFTADNTNFFHLVFADPADDYYMDSYIKTDFLSFLRLKLLEDGFRYLCFIGKTSFNAYQLTLTGMMNEAILKEAPERKSLWDRFRGKKTASLEETLFQKSDVETNIDTLRSDLRNLLQKMGNKKGFAVVCPLDIFVECCEDEATLKALAARRSSPNHNIMVLTGSVDAAEHDGLFRGLAITDATDGAEEGIFRNEELFPCIKSYLRKNRDRDGLSTLPKLIFTYDFLKGAFGDRMHVLNGLSYDTVCSLVKYTLLHSRRTYPRQYRSDDYAALVYAWYAEERFREKYGVLELPENPFRSSSVIADAIRDSDFFEIANRILQTECFGYDGSPAQRIVEALDPDVRGVSVLYDDAMSARRSQFYHCLLMYRRNLKRHMDILSDSERRDLDAITEFFKKPSYPLEVGYDLPHEVCVQFLPKLQELYQSLKKDVWNKWDETAMRLLLVMFRRCYERAQETSNSDEDFTGGCGRLEVEKGIEIIGDCMYNSGKIPEEGLQAKYTCMEAEKVLCSKDRGTLKSYKVHRG